MKRILIILVVNLLFSHFLFTQENSRITTFFNDTLKGKWILESNCLLEYQICDSIGKGIEYIIFNSINSQDFVKVVTNGPWSFENGDSAKLYLPQKTIFGETWVMDDYIFYSYNKICVINENIDKLFLATNSFIGKAKSYKRDKSYLGIRHLINEPITIYPNPFIDKINISYNKPNSTNRVSINIYSATGALLKKIEIAENGQSTKTISLEDLNKGIYFGVVSLNDKWIYNIKLIKK
jgi:hypothetical protein